MRSEHELRSSWAARSAMEGGLEAVLAQTIAAIGPADRTICLGLPAPLVPAERLLNFSGYQDQLLWAPSPEDEQSGVGAAHVLVGAGASRFTQIRDAAARIYRGLVRLDPQRVGAPDPRLLGGFAFQAAHHLHPPGAPRVAHAFGRRP
jgi:hypothetical protein